MPLKRVGAGRLEGARSRPLARLSGLLDPNMSIDDLAKGASATAETMGRFGFKRIAVVRETGGWDQAFLSPGSEVILIRWTALATDGDARALQAIASQGPFDRIFYVFDAGACASSDGFTAVSTEDFAARAAALFS